MIPGVLSFKTIPKLFMCGICKIPFEFCFILMVKHVFARGDDDTQPHTISSLQRLVPPASASSLQQQPTPAHLTPLTYSHMPTPSIRLPYTWRFVLNYIYKSMTFVEYIYGFTTRVIHALT